MPEKNVPIAQPEDVAEALALLTRLPLRARMLRGGRAAWAWPLAGLAVAVLGALTGTLAHALSLPAPLAAGLVLAVLAAATGALHEDGLADCADGFWGGAEPARRLEIMRDSRVGSFGVIALVLAVGLRWSALTVLIEAHWLTGPLIAAAALSRAPMAVLAALLPHARGDGLARSVGRPTGETALLAVAVAFFLAVITAGWAALAAAFWVTLAGIGIAALARDRIGGQTGDVLGATQQIAEIAALIALATMAG
jgi:adenosylcobinamide-GDP ribazoletransferase